jgi:hypothetical protein
MMTLHEDTWGWLWETLSLPGADEVGMHFSRRSRWLKGCLSPRVVSSYRARRYVMLCTLFTGEWSGKVVAVKRRSGRRKAD